MTIQACLETLEATSRRHSPRRKLRLGSTLAGHEQEVLIHDLSGTGVLLQTSAKLEAFDDLEVDLPEIGPTNAFVVWHSGDYYGCEFAHPISRAAISAALLRSPISPSIEAEEPASEVLESGEVAQSDEPSFSTKMRVIVGTSLALWALILFAVGLI